MVVILWLPVVVIKESNRQLGSVSILYYKKLICKTANLISISIISLSKHCNLKNNNTSVYKCNKINVTLNRIAYNKFNLVYNKSYVPSCVQLETK